jgi:four helix bundle suffix protein
MTQSARSGKANIVEGSARSDTSKETEMKLTSVARASLSELHSDYKDWLLRHKLVPWPKSSVQSQAVYSTKLDKPVYGDDQTHDSCAHILVQQKKFARWLDSDDHEIVANALLIIISRAIHTLIRQIGAQGEAFAKAGGFREKLTAVRVETRAGQEGAPACPKCGKPMHRRKAKTGPNAGKEFWGCTGYPDCKTTRPIA